MGSECNLKNRGQSALFPARKRATRKATCCPNWTIVESELIPMPTPEQIAAADAADLARQQRAPHTPAAALHRRLRPCRQRQAHARVAPGRRLDGGTGLRHRKKLHVRVRDGELLVSLTAKD